MSLKDTKLSEVQDLITRVDHLVIQLSQIIEYTPNAERIVIRLEKAKESFELSVQQGLHKIEKALFDLDYSKIQSDLAKIVRHQVTTIMQSIDKVHQYQKTIERMHEKTDTSIETTHGLIETLEYHIDRLGEQLKTIPSFNYRLAIGTGLAGFFAGITTLYFLSLVTWLPKPYFATNEQSVLLGMVQSNVLRLNTTSTDSITIHIDHDLFNQTHQTSGDNQ